MPKYAKPMYQQVADALREEIYSGKNPPGSRLPSRTQLRERFDCSDQVINWAMRILHDQNLIETLHGVGVQVAQTLPPRPAEPE